MHSSCSFYTQSNNCSLNSLEMLFVFCCNWYQTDCSVFSCLDICTKNFAEPQKYFERSAIYSCVDWISRIWGRLAGPMHR